METQKTTLLDEAKKWFNATYVNDDGLNDDADYDADDLPLLAPLSVCTDRVPVSCPLTYAEAVAEMVDIVYAEPEREGAGKKSYDGCESDCAEDDCSRCGTTTTEVVYFTRDRRLAARLDLLYVFDGDPQPYFDSDYDGLSLSYNNTSHAEGAAYDEGEAYDDAAYVACVASQEKAAAREKAAAEQEARELVVIHQQNRADVEKLKTVAALRHPYIQQRAAAFIEVFEKKPTPSGVSYNVRHDFEAALARIGEAAVFAKGARAEVMRDASIGGRAVDHLRSNGWIGVIEHPTPEWENTPGVICRANRKGTRRAFCTAAMIYDLAMAVRS
jgi:hypothetical protein